jgi:hypothetical protein
VKSFFNPSFDYIPNAESVIHDNFERVWREWGEREDSDACGDDDRKSVWLECNGDGGSRVGERHAHSPARTRCRSPRVRLPALQTKHESLSFR